MADPLSIAASIAGLAAAAGKIYSVLSAFVSDVADAPNSAQRALHVVDGVAVTLSMVQSLIGDISSLPSHRKAMIRLDHIIVTLSNCVLTLSELEAVVCKLDDVRSSYRQRLRWVQNQQKVDGLLQHLEAQKTSLMLMVTVLQCRTDLDASQCRDRLDETMLHIMDQNRQLKSRLQRLESIVDPESQSVKFFDSESCVQEIKRPLAQDFPSSDAQVTLSTDTTVEDPPPHTNFELELNISKVYLRVAQNDESDKSAISSVTRSHAWTTLSLNQFSIISVFRLPITLDDISCFGCNLTFVTAMEGRTAHAHSRPGTIALSGNVDDFKSDSSSRVAKTTTGISAGVAPKSTIIKLVLLGDSCTGKSSALICLTTGKYPPHMPEATVFDQYEIKVNLGGEKVCVLQLRDTAGLEGYDSLRPLSYHDTDAIMIFARSGDADCFDNITEKWVPEIRRYCPGVPYIIVGTEDLACDDGRPEARKSNSANMIESRVDMAHQLGAAKYVECHLYSTDSVAKAFQEATIAALESANRRRRRRLRQRIMSAVGIPKGELQLEEISERTKFPLPE